MHSTSEPIKEKDTPKHKATDTSKEKTRTGKTAAEKIHPGTTKQPTTRNTPTKKPIHQRTANMQLLPTASSPTAASTSPMGHKNTSTHKKTINQTLPKMIKIHHLII
ncbi:MAG: hypothetical protein GF334_07420 [Candidatus Altiarchaeales archaeon]|nr:hypothetical protein [Candidatus Altiarchaeales archaeon]